VSLSVVVASLRTRDLAAQTVASLLPQCLARQAELVVAWRGSDDRDSDPVFAGCVVVPCPSEATLPMLRGAGLAAAKGDRVLLTEDNCVARPDWVERLAAGLDEGVDVAGGTMGNAHPDRSVDTAAYLAEYGFFGPLLRAPGGGASPFVTGANVAYSRAVVSQAAEWALEGAWEGTIHHRLLALGTRFALVPDAVVEQNLRYRFGEFCRDRFGHGRTYASGRRAEWGLGKRLVMACATPILPFLLTWRAWQHAGRSDPGGFLRALPLTLSFLGAWGMGEAAGYIFGES